MNKKIVSLVALAVLIQGVSIFAREMRAPLPFRNGFQRFEHYPYVCENLDKCWDFDFWGGAFHRQANDAFTHGTKKQGLAGLYFGADSFSLSQLVPAGSVVPPEFNFVMTPRFNYAENGVMFGFNINHRMCCGTWDVGMRTNIPFVSQSVTLQNCCDLEETIADVIVAFNSPNPELVDSNLGDADNQKFAVENSFAYRLDFLTTLSTVANPITAMVANGTNKFVNYRNRETGSVRANHVTMGDVTVDLAQPPIHVISSPEGVRPDQPFAKRLYLGDNPNEIPYVAPGNQVQGVQNLPILSADGTGVPFTERARFDQGTNYTPLATNIPAQRQLWVVPTATFDDFADFTIMDGASQVRAFVTPFLRNQLLQILQSDASAIDFLRTQGITFDTQNISGAGDLDIDFYARRNFCSECHGDWYVEGITGIRFPTAKPVSNPGLLLAQPLGNNHHFEIKLGAQIGMQPFEWFAFKADAQFYHVFKHTEAVAAPFAGATIKNIGPTIDAQVSWNYFLGNLDFTFLVPCSKNCSGLNIGYQPYFKLQDKVRFAQATATDLANQVVALNPALIESNTKRHGQRLKFELFHKTCNWEIYGGWLHTIAGKNIQRDSDWYLGFGMFF